MSVAGGGILTDVVVSREHTQFRGELYEEVALVGALILLGLLWLTDSHESSRWMIRLGVVLSLATLLVAWYVILTRNIRYPGSRPAVATDSQTDRNDLTIAG
jgi:uncharacterized membrane protein YeiH